MRRTLNRVRHGWLAPRRWPTRRAAIVVGTTAVLSVALLLIVGSASGTLPGSNFESGDGDLVAGDSGGTFDWNAPTPEPISCPSATPGAGTNCGTDLAGPGDNAFGAGTTEDTPDPTVVNEVIPPNKSDLTRFYVNQENAGGADFLYLAWERLSNLAVGTADMDFELNQKSKLGGNGATPVRSAGDILITFDFIAGKGFPPSLVSLTWLTRSRTGQCFSSASPPCWGNAMIQLAEGAVNSTIVHDDNPPPVPGTDLPAQTFGEAGIDLAAISQGKCRSVRSIFLKSRSTAGFGSELKDFIAPIPVKISTCA